MKGTRTLGISAAGALVGALLAALAGLQAVFAFNAYPASDDDSSLRSGVAFSGFAESVNRVLFDGGSVDANRNTVDVKCTGGGEKAGFLAEAALELPGFSEFSEIPDLAARGSVEPVALSLKEAYLDLYGFPFGAMDVRLGKQIVVWGKGDKINPTANVSPSDLSDIFDFGNKLGINALQTNLYLDALTFTAIYSPVFTPSLLPENYIEILGLDAPSIVSNTVDKPSDDLEEGSQFAARLAFGIGGYDLSLSYCYGRYTVPAVNEIVVKFGSLPSIEPTQTKSKFPRLQVVGIDLSGELFKLGVWGEAGLFIPEGYTRITIAEPGPVVVDSEVVDEPYLRYVLGCDYTFRSGLYVNLQFVHGFDLETEKERLGDYLTVRVEKKLFHDKLTLLPLTFLVGTEKWSDLAGHYGVGYGPELRYLPFDNVEIDLGTFLIHGEGENFLARLRDYDSIFLKAKASF
jgi:hypothetical protein